MPDMRTDAERLRELGRDIFYHTQRQRTADLVLIPVLDYSHFASEDMGFYDRVRTEFEANGLFWLGDVQPVMDPPQEEPGLAAFVRVLASGDGSVVVEAQLVKPEIRARMLHIESDHRPLLRRMILVNTQYLPRFVLSTDNLLHQVFEHNMPCERKVRMAKTTSVRELLDRHRAEMEWLSTNRPTLVVQPVRSIDEYMKAVAQEHQAVRRYHDANGYLSDAEVLFWLKGYDLIPGAKRGIMAGVAEARAAALAGRS